MAFDLKNKKVLVTGSTDGLGKLMALNLTALGAQVIIHGRNEEKVRQTISELTSSHPQELITGMVSDFTQEEQALSHFAQIHDLDILINNAGVWLEGATATTPVEKIVSLTQINLMGHMLLTRTLLPVLLKSEFAQILNVSSIAGVEIPFDYFHTIYSATKFGLQGFSEAMAKEFAGKNLRVMGFYPGSMNTELFKKAGNEYKRGVSEMFDPQESVDAMLFMLTRSPKVNVKRMDLINHLEN